MQPGQAASVLGSKLLKSFDDGSFYGVTVIIDPSVYYSLSAGDRVILIEDMNGSIPGGRHNYAHSMEKNLAEADDRLANFCANSK